MLASIRAHNYSPLTLEPGSTRPKTGFLTVRPQTSCAHHAMLPYTGMLTTFHVMLLNKSYNENNDYNNLQ